MSPKPDPTSSGGLLGTVGTFIGKHGVSTLFACVLLWLLVYKLPPIVEARFEAQAESDLALASALQEHVEATAHRSAEALAVDRQLLQLAWLTCRNTAKTRAASDACDAVWR
jgi:hypothetical protein